MESSGHFGLGLGHRDTRTQAAHDIDPVRMRIDEHGVALVSVVTVERRAICHGDIKSRSKARSHSKKFRRSDTSDREGNILDAYCLADGCRISSKPLAPIFIAEDSYLRNASAIVAIGDKASYCRNDSETVKKFTGYIFD